MQGSLQGAFFCFYLSRPAPTLIDSPRITILNTKEITDCSRVILRTSAICEATAMMNEKGVKSR